MLLSIYDIVKQGLIFISYWILRTQIKEKKKKNIYIYIYIQGFKKKVPQLFTTHCPFFHFYHSQ
jgi:hypothetical protein